MKTIEQIKDLMIGKSVIADLADLLRANDTDFAESEKNYYAAVEKLRAALPTEQTPTLDEYLSACETDVISVVAYAGYLGFRVNLENFHHPIGIDFVRLDTIDYLKDHLQISPERCEVFASGGVSISIPAVWLFRMNGAFSACV